MNHKTKPRLKSIKQYWRVRQDVQVHNVEILRLLSNLAEKTCEIVNPDDVEEISHKELDKIAGLMSQRDFWKTLTTQYEQEVD